MPAIEAFWAVIPAGGAGTRLWPLSRSSSPKFLHDLTGSGRTLLQETYDRLHPLAEDRFLVVTGEAHRAAVSAQLDALGAEAVLAEPSARDSMAAIGLAAALLERADPSAVMGSFAADHVITDPEAFAETVRLAVRVAREDWLVTLGIEPTFPSSAFGYIHLGAALAGHEGAAHVEEFVEKPSPEVAKGYLATGSYRWNAGMFVVRPTVLLDLLARWHPDFAARCARSPPTPAGWGRSGRRCRRSRSTTPSPSRPPRRAASWWCRRPSAGTTSATSTRWRPCSSRARPRRACSGTARWCMPSTAPGSWCPATGGWSRSSGSTTWSWSTPPDAAPGHHARTRPGGQAIVAALKEAGRADLT